jgi:hypothetical protein
VVYKSGANRNTVNLRQDVTVEDFASNVWKTVSKSETAVEYEYGQKSYVKCEKFLQQEAVKDLAQSRNNVMKNPELREKSCSKGALGPISIGGNIGITVENIHLEKKKVQYLRGKECRT